MPKQIGRLTLYSSKEIADILEISINSIRAYINEGRLKGQKVGGSWYVSEEALADWFNKDNSPLINAIQAIYNGAQSVEKARTEGPTKFDKAFQRFYEDLKAIKADLGISNNK